MADASDPRIRAEELARSFPSLRNAPGVKPWDAAVLDEWAAQAVASGERHAAAFVLAVWDPSHEWRSGRFDVMDALGAWDTKHREAFLAWARGPWWA